MVTHLTHLTHDPLTHFHLWTQRSCSTPDQVTIQAFGRQLHRAVIDARAWYPGRYKNSRVITSKYLDIWGLITTRNNRLTSSARQTGIELQCLPSVNAINKQFPSKPIHVHESGFTTALGLMGDPVMLCLPDTVPLMRRRYCMAANRNRYTILCGVRDNSEVLIQSCLSLRLGVHISL